MIVGKKCKFALLSTASSVSPTSCAKSRTMENPVLELFKTPQSGPQKKRLQQRQSGKWELVLSPHRLSFFTISEISKRRRARAHLTPHSQAHTHRCEIDRWENGGWEWRNDGVVAFGYGNTRIRELEGMIDDMLLTGSRRGHLTAGNNRSLH